MTKYWIPLFLSLVCCRAEIVDRVSIVVDDSIIKHSDIIQDIRLTDFLNHETPSFTLSEQKKAAARLIDQTLIRKELESGLYSSPDPAEVDSLLQQIKRGFASGAAYQRALATYNLSEAELRRRLDWQLTVLRFINLRFGADAPVTEAEARAYYEKHLPEFKKTARTAGDFEAARPEIEKAINGERVNQQFFAWLEDTEKNTPVSYNEVDLK